MIWYEEAVFYHIYPLGLLGAPEHNDHEAPVHRLEELKEWILHMKDCGFTAIYLGPCFSSGSHGYDTSDYRMVDERLGDNDDLKKFVRLCHEEGIRVILDGVFNHTGREFFAFRDLKENREGSRYKSWYCNVNFRGNNSYGDGFSYDNWGGHDLLPKLNLQEQEVRRYHFDTVRFWVSEFDIDGLRLDAADVLDPGFMRELRSLTDSLKDDFWLMGEVIHGEYGRWVNESMLHSVTNYALHKALYSAHNDHNYFEIAHTIRRQRDMGLGDSVHLYNFVDNHDTERIMTKLHDKDHFLPVHVLLYTLPGIPSVYYGSEFGLEGKKEWGTDASLRPALSLADLSRQDDPRLQLIRTLGALYKEKDELWSGEYREIDLTTTKYAFLRGDLLITVTNSNQEENFDLDLKDSYIGALHGKRISPDNGRLKFTLEGNSAEIWIPASEEHPASEEQKLQPAAAMGKNPEDSGGESIGEEETLPQPRRSVAFIGSECYPFVKTGGLGDVMYALPRALASLNCDVKVIIPRYHCIPWEYQEKMVYRGSFSMDLCADGRSYYVGIMEYVWDGVVYDFIDNNDFFANGDPYLNLVDDIPRYCYFCKAALAALNYMDWVPDIIHCHDWQASLVPVLLRTQFANTGIKDAKTILTIHNLRFQGVYNIPTLRYWTNLPEYLFNKDVFKTGYEDANMLKGGLTYTDIITTVSRTYAEEIKTPFFGENLDAHLRYHSGKLRGIVNGIDTAQWDPANDKRLAETYDISNVLVKKKANKRALQQELGLEADDGKFVIGLISRLTDQKGLDLVNEILPSLIDGNTQIVVLGTGDARYEDSFRRFENAFRGTVCSCIMYDEGRAHRIYAGADALLVPSLFEPCGLTQLIAMRYGTVPVVRETGGLKDTVEPYNQFANEGNGFTFDRYESGLLYDAVNRAKTLFFTDRRHWDEMVLRDMARDVSWQASAEQYRALYLELKP